MRSIVLSGKVAKALNLVAVVDDEDYEKVRHHNWYASPAYKQPDRIYATAWINGRNIHMHRLLLAEEARDRDIDHINRDGLDNRRENLRIGTRSQNSANRGKPRGEYSSRYKGVYWERARWKASICVMYRNIKLGTFTDEREAALAYDRAALKYFGEFAWLNLPDEAVA